MTNVSANNANQLIHYHSNHHFSIVQVKPECWCSYINNRLTVIEITVSSLQQMLEMMSFHTDAQSHFVLGSIPVCQQHRCWQLFALFISLPLPNFLVIDPVCFKCLTKSFNVLFFQPLAGNSFISLTAPQPLAKYKFLIQILRFTLKPIVLSSVYI